RGTESGVPRAGVLDVDKTDVYRRLRDPGTERGIADYSTGTRNATRRAGSGRAARGSGDDAAPGSAERGRDSAGRPKPLVLVPVEERLQLALRDGGATRDGAERQNDQQPQPATGRLHGLMVERARARVVRASGQI